MHLNTYEKTTKVIKDLHSVIQTINEIDFKSLIEAHKSLPIEIGKETRHELYQAEGTYARKLLSLLQGKEKKWINDVSFFSVLTLLADFQKQNEKLDEAKETV